MNISDTIYYSLFINSQFFIKNGAVDRPSVKQLWNPVTELCLYIPYYYKFIKSTVNPELLVYRNICTNIFVCLYVYAKIKSGFIIN